MNYWGQTGCIITRRRFFFVFSPTPLIFALREAMRLVVEEGLDARLGGGIVLTQLALSPVLEALGLDRLVKNPADRLADGHCGNDSHRPSMT